MSRDDLKMGPAREILCRLLAACYYEPGPEFAEERVFEAMREAAACLGPQLAAVAGRLESVFSAALLEDLLIDYTRLFLGPNQILAKPYGSVWLSGENTLMQASTVTVLELYREGGFELDEGFRDLPDHVAAELEFLYLLIFRENQARLARQHVQLTATVDLRKLFLDEHLGAWIGPFTAAVRAGAQSEFYRLLGELTDRFVRMERGKPAG